MKIKNIEIYIEAAAEVMMMPFVDITKVRHHRQIKYVMLFAKEYGFNEQKMIEKFGKYRSYYTMILKQYPDLLQSNEYKTFAAQLEKTYEHKIETLSTTDFQISKNNTVINNLRDRLLFVLQENKNLKYQITFLQKNLKKKYKKSNKSQDVLLNKIKSLIIEYNATDTSRFNAKYILTKITKLFFNDLPVTDFDRRQYFLKKQKNIK